MCEELSDCAVMTDGAGAVFQRGVIKVKLWVPGRERGNAGAGAGWGGREQGRRKRELDQIRQMIRAISQCGKVLDDGECYFLPVHCGVKGQWGAKSVTSDPVTSRRYWFVFRRWLAVWLSAGHDCPPRPRVKAANFRQSGRIIEHLKAHYCIKSNAVSQ